MRQGAEMVKATNLNQEDAGSSTIFFLPLPDATPDSHESSTPRV